MFLILALLFSFSLSANDCGPKPSLDKGNKFVVYLECEEIDPSCKQYRDEKNLTYYLDRNSKIPINVKSAQLKSTFRGNKQIISVQLKSNTECFFSEMSKVNLGRRVFFFYDDKLITAPTITQQLRGGFLQLTLGQNSSYSDIKNVCRLLHKRCGKKERVQPKNVFSKLIIPTLTNEMTKKFQNINESEIWFSNKSKIEVFESSDLIPNGEDFITKEDWQTKKFVGRQEFNISRRKYVQKNNAIYFKSWGWIKRSDLIPQNSLYDIGTLESRIASAYLLKKCPDQVKEKISEFQIGDQYKILRDASVALCSKKTRAYCATRLRELKTESRGMKCSDIK